MRLRILIFFLVTIFLDAFNTFAQEACGTVNHKEPWDFFYWGNNNVLNEIVGIINRDMRLAAEDIANYRIPIRFWIHADDNGANKAIERDRLRELVNQVNWLFEKNYADVKTYIKCAPEIVYSTRYNHLTHTVVNEMLGNNRDLGALNVHLVWSYSGIGGKGNFPGETLEFTNVVATTENGGFLPIDKIARALIHQIGHNFGNLHTHEGYETGYNGSEKKCHQESVSRSKNQGFPCHSLGSNKCEVNGDYLCDTEAAPNTQTSSVINVDGLCNYAGGGTDSWGSSWNPPMRNFMSHVSNVFCQDQFTKSQLDVFKTWMYREFRYNGEPLQSFIGEVTFNTVLQTWDYYLSESINFSKPDGTGHCSIDQGASVKATAQEEISIYPGFEVLSGASFHTKVDDIEDCSKVWPGSSPSYIPPIKDNPVLENNVARLVENRLEQNKSLMVEFKQKESMVNYLVNFPNPTTGKFTVGVGYAEQQIHLTIQIFDLMGNEVWYYADENVDEKTYEVNIEDHESGIYFIKVMTENAVKTGKISLRR